MFRPTHTNTAVLRPTSTREIPCRNRFDAHDRLWRAVDAGRSLGLIEPPVADEQGLIGFLEAELGDWSRHPSSSTWSQPPRDDD